MFIVNVIKCAVLRRQHGLMTSAVSCVARVGQSSDSPRCRTAVTANAVYKSLSLNFRQFSCTCATNFRTANSFACYTDNDDSEASASGKEVITSKDIHSGNWLWWIVICQKSTEFGYHSAEITVCVFVSFLGAHGYCSLLLENVIDYIVVLLLSLLLLLFFYFRSPAQIMYIVHCTQKYWMWEKCKWLNWCFIQWSW